MADGQDIYGSGNTRMPQYPAGMPLWQRILCLLDYHKMEIRYAPRRIRDDGMVLEPMRLRDQCARCRCLANNNLKDPKREAKAKAFADIQPTRQRFL